MDYIPRYMPYGATTDELDKLFKILQIKFLSHLESEKESLDDELKTTISYLIEEARETRDFLIRNVHHQLTLKNFKELDEKIDIFLSQIIQIEEENEKLKEQTK